MVSGEIWNPIPSRQYPAASSSILVPITLPESSLRWPTLRITYLSGQRTKATWAHRLAPTTLGDNWNFTILVAELMPLLLLLLSFIIVTGINHRHHLADSTNHPQSASNHNNNNHNSNVNSSSSSALEKNVLSRNCKNHSGNINYSLLSTLLTSYQLQPKHTLVTLP